MILFYVKDINEYTQMYAHEGYCIVFTILSVTLYFNRNQAIMLDTLHLHYNSHYVIVLHSIFYCVHFH